MILRTTKIKSLDHQGQNSVVPHPHVSGLQRRQKTWIWACVGIVRGRRDCSAHDEELYHLLVDNRYMGL